jgi:cytoplasmic iron level regulating protein YaaA (DUF328/UPF0246 family)
MMLIISPSKTMNNNGMLAGTQSEPIYADQANTIIETIKKLDLAGIRKLMSVSEKIAVETYNRFQDINTPGQAKKSAIFLYSGEVYAGLDAVSFHEDKLIYAQKHLRILSGLYGILRPLDLIGAYRLEMATRIEIGKQPNLYKYWTGAITSQLQLDMDASGSDILYNLGSEEYFKAIDTKKLKARIINFQFYEIRNGKPVFVSFNAKKARGMMARYIIHNRIFDPEKLTIFNDDGYQYSSSLSSENTFAFVRPLVVAMALK